MHKFFFILMLLSSCVVTAVAQTAPAVTLKGQIVCCVDCWVRADRTKVPYGTKADLQKAADCVSKGDPTLLAVLDAAGKTTFYELEQGRFKRPGKNWLELVGKHVEITGTTRTRKEQNYVKVDTLTVTATPQPEISIPAVDAITTESDLVLQDLTGATQKLTAYQGKIVVLNFWATWCIPCRKEMPDLTAIQNEYAALGVQVIGASADDADERAAVLKFVRDVRVNFPVWLGATAEQMNRYGLAGELPATLIINREGKIVHRISGIVKKEDLRKQIDALLVVPQAQATPATPREQAAAGVAGASSVPS